MGSDDAMQHTRTGIRPAAFFQQSPADRRVEARQRVPLKDQFQQTIITIHRWLGIVACLYFVVWFVSGLVLAYVAWPAMDADDKLKVLRPLDWNKVEVAPDAALTRAGMSEFPQDLRLEMAGDQPVYRISDWEGKHHTVSAVTGAPIKGVTGEQALKIVRDQLSAPEATLHKGDLFRDQWTVTGYWNKERPFHLIRMNDPAGTEYYVSVATGEIVLDTQRYERMWNWVGAIPHWLYFEIVRWDTFVWQWTIYILAGAGIFIAVSGMWIGFSRLRLRSRYANGEASPFRGWMKWHHIVGILGGIFLTSWIISGFWTMYPGGVLETREIEQAEFTGFAGSASSQFNAAALGTLAGEDAKIRRATFLRVGGEALAVLEDGVSDPRLVNAETGQPRELSVDQIADAARKIMPQANLVSAARLETGDEYWHSGFYPKKTPIVRVVFDDPENSWFHIDPQTGKIEGLVNDTSRIDRWTIVAFHDLDVKWLLERRPLWDIILFAVTLPGLLLSITAMVIGWRRLQRTRLLPAGGVTALLGGSFGAAAKPISYTPPDARSDTVLVIYASQTGTAEQLAAQTAESLRSAGLKVAVRDLGQVDAASLAEVQQAIFLVATTGDGDAPDHAMAFERRIMRQVPALHGLKYAMLALGDRQYRVFCGFGMALDRWLQAAGAERIFPTIQAHDADPEALNRWSRELGAITGRTDAMSITRAPFSPWRLVDRRLLNPGSAGWPAIHLELEPVSGAADWEAGDIAQIAAGLTWREFSSGAAELSEREYSIASTSVDGRIDLLVRLMRTEKGEPGVASGLLSTVALGEQLPLRIRRNPGFHPPADDRPMILIGNGTGLAGLRAHIRRRAAKDHRRNWLIFGERNAATDAFYKDEIDAWLMSGRLERADLVFSRDQAERRYVQHQLVEVGGEIRAWVRDGAAIYVCGSLQGMAPAVTEALIEILGEDGFDNLTRGGNYRRDVY